MVDWKMAAIPKEVFALLPIQFQYYFSPSEKTDWGNYMQIFLGGKGSREFWDKMAIPVSEVQQNKAEQKIYLLINQ